MDSIIVFDSYFGNTEKIGRAIAQAIPGVVVRRVSHTTPSDLRGYDLIILGSPTRAFRPTQNMTELLKNVKSTDVNRSLIATFDTRINPNVNRSMVVKTLFQLGGYAAPTLQKIMFKKGAKPIVPSEGFWVTEYEGPPCEGEIERAVEWGKRIADICLDLVIQD